MTYPFPIFIWNMTNLNSFQDFLFDLLVLNFVHTVKQLVIAVDIFVEILDLRRSGAAPVSPYPGLGYIS